MKNRLNYCFIIFLVIIQSTFSQSESIDNETLATKYLALYTSMNFDEIASYYNESSIFEDPTSSFFSQNSTYEIKTGPDSIIAFLQEGFSKISDISYEIDTKYNVGVVNYTSGILNYKFEISTNGETKKLDFELPLTIILTIKEGKIVHHQDIANYKVWYEQYARQLEQK